MTTVAFLGFDQPIRTVLPSSLRPVEPTESTPRQSRSCKSRTPSPSGTPIQTTLVKAYVSCSDLSEPERRSSTIAFSSHAPPSFLPPGRSSQDSERVVGAGMGYKMTEFWEFPPALQPHVLPLQSRSS